MKFLMMMALSTFITSTAFAACGINSPDSLKECLTQQSCEGLTEKDGRKFTFDEKKEPKCQVVSTEKTTTCLQTNNAQGAKPATDTTVNGKASSNSNKDIAK